MLRSIILTLSVALSTLLLHAATETLYLKNGSVIKGEIIEQIPGKSLKIQTRDGSIFVYNMDEVEKITKEAATSKRNDADAGCNIRHRKLDVSLGTGYEIATKGGSGAIPVDVIFSKRFNRNFSFGIGSGVQIPSGSGDLRIPLYANFRAFAPIDTWKATPYLDLKLGYVFNTAGDKEYGEGQFKSSVSMPNFVMFSIIPTIRVPLSHRTDLDLGIGYQHYVASGDGGDGFGNIAFRVGFNFHASTDPNKVRTPKVETPTRDKGFELAIEGNALKNRGGANLLLGYKASPHFNFALGLGYSLTGVECTNCTHKEYSGPDGTGEVTNTRVEGNYDGDRGHTIFNSGRIFLRGKYRVFDKKFSPFVSVDLGYCMYDNDESTFDDYYGYDYSDHGNTYNIDGLYLRPAIGISWRAKRNTCFELGIGYDIMTKGIPDEKYTANHFNKTESYSYESKGCSLSGMSISLSWVHTFGSRSK